uniref:Estradiol 17-beta-dehydrogenase 11 n=1 Tax=Corvus moneduloides TaxID=1196302 RepID=A0A8C3EP76_CORMO
MASGERPPWSSPSARAGWFCGTSISPLPSVSGWDAERQQSVWPHLQQRMWGSGPTVTRCYSGGSRQHPAEHLREGKKRSGSCWWTRCPGWQEKPAETRRLFPQRSRLFDWNAKKPWQLEDGQIQTCSMALRRDPGQVLGVRATGRHGVEETAAECQKLGATVQTFVVDCSKREEIYSAADKVKKEIGDVTILVNNAGVITAADFLSTQDHQIERMFEVNILGHMWTTRAFLPVMMNNNYGHIVTVASAAGHFVIPFMVAYCSSKFAAVGFHKALTEELSALGKDGIKTTCLCPVFINTGFVKNPTVRLGKILEIEEVVEALMEGIVTNQKMVFVPPQLNIALLSEMVFPERALNVLKKLAIPKFDAVIGQRSTQ